MTARCPSRTAHPRSRGENGPGIPSISRPPGSSPLTRGKRAAWAALRGGVGLIPAHAGKTARPTSSGNPLGAHPRSRGENSCARGRWTTAPGSSPLTRGKLVGGRVVGAGGGLIPAHAGKTGGGASLVWVSGAHPRSRGENAFHAPHRGTSPGSSPLTRGKHCPAVGSPGARRLIPAHAGKTRAKCNSSNPARAHPRSRGENVQNMDCDAIPRGSSPLTRGKPS